MNTNAQSSTKSGGYICDACDTVRHCSKHGCVPVQPPARSAARMSRAGLQPALVGLLSGLRRDQIEEAVALLLDYIDQRGSRA